MPAPTSGAPKPKKGGAADKFRKPPHINWRDKLHDAKTKKESEALSILKEIRDRKDKSSVPGLIEHLYDLYVDQRGFGGPDHRFHLLERLEIRALICELGLEDRHIRLVMRNPEIDPLVSLGLLDDDRVPPLLISALNGANEYEIERAAEAIIYQVRNFYRAQDFSCAVPRLIELADIFTDRLCGEGHGGKFSAHGALVQVLKALGSIKDKRAVVPLKSLYKKLRSSDQDIRLDYSHQLGKALQDLGLSPENISSFEREADKKSLDEYMDSDHDRAILSLLRRPDAKRLVLQDASAISALPDPQAWISINDPQTAKDALLIFRQRLPAKMGLLDDLLEANIGIPVSRLEEAHFRYYPDEIIDSIMQIASNSRLKDDPLFQAVSSKFRYTEGIRLRYTKRCEADLSLGDKCGDCTAKGSINFRNSLRWYPTPAYNILIMHKGTRFVGKVNFTLGTLAGEEGIIIDALEFNPQAKKGKPYHEAGKECLDAALAFLRDLALKEGKGLFAVRISNSEGAEKILFDYGEPLPNFVKDGFEIFNPDMSGKNDLVGLKLYPAHLDALHALSHVGYRGSIQTFYQMHASVRRVPSFGAGPENLIDKKIPVLEREVVNPAQISDPAIGKAMSERDFKVAASMILADKSRNEQVMAIFGIPKTLTISSEFLAKKLETMYKVQAIDTSSDYVCFVQGSDFVRL